MNTEYTITLTLTENEKVIASPRLSRVESVARDERKLRELLVQLQQHARAQGPYFNSRLLTKIERIESLLSDGS